MKRDGGLAISSRGRGRGDVATFLKPVKRKVAQSRRRRLGGGRKLIRIRSRALGKESRGSSKSGQTAPEEPRRQYFNDLLLIRRESNNKGGIEG